MKEHDWMRLRDARGRPHLDVHLPDHLAPLALADIFAADVELPVSAHGGWQQRHAGPRFLGSRRDLTQRHERHDQIFHGTSP
jgi:hypothetical protein